MLMVFFAEYFYSPFFFFLIYSCFMVLLIEGKGYLDFRLVTGSDTFVQKYQDKHSW